MEEGQKVLLPFSQKGACLLMVKVSTQMKLLPCHPSSQVLPFMDSMVAHIMDYNDLTHCIGALNLLAPSYEDFPL